MPQTKSAKKAQRQSLRRRAINLAVLKKLKAAVKKFRKNPKYAEFVKTQSVVDTATKKKVISKNKASRIKSRLSKLLSKTKVAKKKSNQGLTKRKRAVNLNKKE